MTAIIPPPSTLELDWGMAIQAALTVAMGVLGLLFTIIISNVRTLRKELSSAIEERNNKIAAVEARVAGCQAEHLQRLARAELRQQDLARIDSAITGIYDRLNDGTEAQAAMGAKMDEVLRFVHKVMDGEVKR